MDTLLRVEGLSKKYSRNLKASIRYAASDLLHSVKGNKIKDVKLRDSEFWALRDINFSLCRGEVLAVLGHNGAGKSTLLKCIAGKLNYEQGRVVCNGELGHLLEMSAGFSPTLTGRDNVSVRGQLMGKRGKDLQRYISQVEDFAEIDEFFNSPVQFYSSGMKTRLGFAASSVIEPDIIILDEILAVGDLGFRMKCYSRIDELRKKCAVILVTHSMNHVSRMADSSMLLEKGRVTFQGNPQQGIQLYQDAVSMGWEKKRVINFMPDLVDFKLIVRDGGSVLVPNGSIDFGTELTVSASVYTESPVSISVILHEQGGAAIAEWNSKRSNFHASPNKPLLAQLGTQNLCPGSYYIALVGFNAGEQVFLSDPYRFKVVGNYYNAIRFQPIAEWSDLN